MVAMTARVVAAILMWAFSSAATIAQPTGSDTPRAPAIHQATGLKFPSMVGRDIRLARSIDYGRSEAKPELGYSLTYLVAPPLDGVARVNIFNGGLTSIPSGADNTLVFEQFDQLLDEIRQLTPEADGVTIVNGPAACSPGGISFRCVTLRAVIPKTQIPIYSTLAVTSYRNHFFSIWLEWNGTKAAPATAEAYINDLVDAMTR
jgi:hypothetical protein